MVATEAIKPGCSPGGLFDNYNYWNKSAQFTANNTIQI
jgi:hypothetical protein